MTALNILNPEKSLVDGQDQHLCEEHLTTHQVVRQYCLIFEAEEDFESQLHGKVLNNIK